MKVKDLIRIIDRAAPFDLAMDWDNSGLQVGSPEGEVRRIGLALDATVYVVDQALALGCDLLLTHHPLIFKPLKNISLTTLAGAVIGRALAGGLNIVSAHTNWDSAHGGVASALADLLELKDQRPLESAARDFYKLTVFVPAGYEERVKKAVFEAGAGTVGDYDHCWFAADGQGGFRTPEGAHPFIGAPGRAERTRESRLEMIVPPDLTEPATAAVMASHPYEEPAFEFHPVKVYGPGEGLGLVGRWNPARDVLAECRQKLGNNFKWAGPKPGVVKRVALLPGSGGSYLKAAQAAGAEVLITGDVGYHQALEADHLGLTVVDFGHFETEWPGVARLKERLSREILCQGFEAECLLITQSPPWRYNAEAVEI